MSLSGPICQGNVIYPDIESLLSSQGHAAPDNTTWFVTKIHSKNYPLNYNPETKVLRINRVGMELLGLPWAKQPEPIRPQIVAPEVHQATQSENHLQPQIVTYGANGGRSPVASPVTFH